jgi:hypothetical protein
MPSLPPIRVQQHAAPGIKLALCGVIWLGTVAGGLTALSLYSMTSGAPAEAPHDWPANSGLRLDAQLPTLVMIVHPHCPCSRASLAELNSLMTRLQGRVVAHVLLSTPEGLDEAWAEGPLWQLARIIPDTEVRVDLDGVQADMFGAKTSGQTYLFSTEGELLFSGGITPSRGHQGNSVGRERIIALVTEGTAERHVSDVFGCPIEANDGPAQFRNSKPTTEITAYAQQRE